MLEQGQRRNAENLGELRPGSFRRIQEPQERRVMPVAKRMKPVTKERWLVLHYICKRTDFEGVFSAEYFIFLQQLILSRLSALHQSMWEMLLLEMEVGRGESFQKEAAPWGPRTHRVSGRLVQMLLKQVQNFLPLSLSRGTPASSSDFCNS